MAATIIEGKACQACGERKWYPPDRSGKIRCVECAARRGRKRRELQRQEEGPDMRYASQRRNGACVICGSPCTGYLCKDPACKDVIADRLANALRAATMRGQVWPPESRSTTTNRRR